jgi:hypothetical protein
MFELKNKHSIELIIKFAAWAHIIDFLIILNYERIDLSKNRSRHH